MCVHAWVCVDVCAPHSMPTERARGAGVGWGGGGCAAFQLFRSGAAATDMWSCLTPHTCQESVRLFFVENIFARTRGHARCETPQGLFSTLLPLLPVTHPDFARGSAGLSRARNATTCFAVFIVRLKVCFGVFFLVFFFGRNPHIQQQKNGTCV